jgi:hypothetical protein
MVKPGDYVNKASSEQRKQMPIACGVMDYFPDALAVVAEHSKYGNDKHNPQQPLHWSREKSTDHADCIVRHLIGRGTKDADGTRHSAGLAWRALALLQLEIEAEQQQQEKSVPSVAVSATAQSDDVRSATARATTANNKYADRSQIYAGTTVFYKRADYVAVWGEFMCMQIETTLPQNCPWLPEGEHLNRQPDALMGFDADDRC